MVERLYRRQGRPAREGRTSCLTRPANTEISTSIQRCPHAPTPHCSRSIGMPDRDASEQVIAIAGMRTLFARFDDAPSRIRSRSGLTCADGPSARRESRRRRAKLPGLSSGRRPLSRTWRRICRRTRRSPPRPPRGLARRRFHEGLFSCWLGPRGRPCSAHWRSYGPNTVDAGWWERPARLPSRSRAPRRRPRGPGRSRAHAA